MLVSIVWVLHSFYTLLNGDSTNKNFTKHSQMAFKGKKCTPVCSYYIRILQRQQQATAVITLAIFELGWIMRSNKSDNVIRQI